MGINYRSFSNGIRIEPKATDDSSRAGEIDFQTSDAKYYAHDGNAASPIVTEISIATLANKTLVNPIISGTMAGLTNTDLALASNGTGNITLDNVIVKNNVITSSTGTLSLSSVIINSSGITVQSGKTLSLTDSTTGTISLSAPTTVVSPYTIALPANPPSANTGLSFDGTNYVWSATAGSTSLLPITNDTYTVGNSTHRFLSVDTDRLNLYNSSATQQAFISGAPVVFPNSLTAIGFSGANDNSVGITSNNNNVNDSNTTGQLFLFTGNKGAGTGNSGDIHVQTGTSAGGTRGRVFLNGNTINLSAQYASDPTGIDIGDIYYNTTIKALKVYNGTVWSPIGSGQFSTTTVNTITSGGTIALGLGGFQMIRVQGSGPDTLASTTPFGSVPPSDGTVINLVGQSNTNNLLVDTSDSTNGMLLNGPCSLTRAITLSVMYDAILLRYIEISRTAIVQITN